MSKWCLIDHGHNLDKWNTPERIQHLLNNVTAQYDLKGFIIASGSEVDVGIIYGLVIDELKDYCNSTGKKIYIFAACKQDAYDYPDHVVSMQCQTFDTQHYYDGLTSFTEPSAPNLLFTCYNNRPCDYRHYTINNLFGRGLQDLGIVTYKKYTVDHPKDPGWTPNMWEPLSNIPYLTPINDPSEPDFVLNSKREWTPGTMPFNYLKGVIDIVTESRIGKNEFYLSEKTNKALLADKPFLVVGAPGYHRWLQQERHLELYDEIFDYSFDDEPDYRKRIDGILDNLERLSKIYKSPPHYQLLWNNVKAKTQRNFIKHMVTLRSGIHLESILHFIGLNSNDPNEYRLECVDKFLTKDHKDILGSDFHVTLDFFRQVVVPYRNNLKYVGDNFWEKYNGPSELKGLWEAGIE